MTTAGIEQRALKRLRAICAALPEVNQVVTWGHPTFRAGRKPFAVLEWYRGHLSIAFRTGLAHQRTLVKNPRFYVTPYVGKHGWVSMKIDGATRWTEVNVLVTESYRPGAGKRLTAALDARAHAAAGPRRRASRARQTRT